MQRRGESGQPAKGQRQRAKPKARKVPTARASIADRDELLDQRARERDEALEQVSATSEILKIISKSPGELEPVFDVMLENATRICAAKFATLYLRGGNTWRAVAATRNAPPEYVEVRKRNLLQLSSGGPLDQIVNTKQVVHIADMKEMRPYRERHPTIVAAVELGGFRTCLMVPMLRDDELVGAISILRQEVRPFTDKQIKLVENFATQAVIAIENARLLNELRQRTGDLSESLEQQTATSEVLKVISSSPGELKPVFEAMLANATRICEAKFGNLLLLEGDGFRTVALHGAPPAYAEARCREPMIRYGPGTAGDRVARTKQPVQIADIRKEPAYVNDPRRFAILEHAGARTMLNVPMLKENQLVGQIAIYRQEVRPFTDKQVELVQNFAAQAVIAIENTRLLNELRESLEHQMATSEVLNVISRSPTNVQPVFNAIVESASRLCQAGFGVVWRYDGDLLHYAASHNFTPEVLDRIIKTYPKRPDRSLAAGRAILDGRIAHVPDMLADPGYAHELALAGNWRATIAVPMLREGKPIGAISVGKAEAGPFSERQMQLLSTFADQAVIAIENVRLFNETEEALDQQTATADVLKVISRSTFDLRTVLDTLVESVTRLCGADHAWLFQREGEFFHWVAGYGHATEVHAQIAEYFRNRQVPADRGSVTGRTALEGKVVHIPDVLADPDYTWSEAQKIGSYRAALGVPLLQKGGVVGVIFIVKTVPEPFTEKQIELATTFADQAVIAIENTRLLSELRESLRRRT